MFPVWIPEITHLHKTSLICEDAEKLQFLLSAAVTLSVCENPRHFNCSVSSQIVLQRW